MLAVSWDTIRLFLHVLAATIWVGGQLVLAALVPVLRRAGVVTEAARRFNQVTRDFLDRVVGRLFQVGLNLQAASGLPADVLRARLAEALDQLDDAILQIRNYAFGSGDPAPLGTGSSSS